MNALGPIVTGLLPVGLIGGLILAAFAYRKGQTAITIVAAVFAVVCGVGMVAFMGVVRA